MSVGARRDVFGDVVGPLLASLSAGPALPARGRVRTGDLEVVRLLIAAGQAFSINQAAGEITIQCLCGRVSFTARGKTRELSTGQFVCLAQGEPFGVTGLEESTLLITRTRPKQGMSSPLAIIPTSAARIGAAPDLSAAPVSAPSSVSSSGPPPQPESAASKKLNVSARDRRRAADIRRRFLRWHPFRSDRPRRRPRPTS